MRLKKAFLMILGLLFSIPCLAQDFIDTEGKDFWLTFMPNYHNNNAPNQTDSLLIFISSKIPAKGSITYKNRQGQVFTKNFNIIDPTEIFTFAISFYNIELMGFNESGDIISDGQNERIAPQSFHVVSDQEVTVYALNQASLTSEAFLVIPTDAIGTDYYILTYNSDGGEELGGSSTPSQFAVVASEDNTRVTIKPSVPTARNLLNTQQITIQKGEVYLVQALITNNQLNNDLTGSLVQADKPIAVFAGQQRATVPVNVVPRASRDCLIEQMIPIKSWGKNAIVIPFAQPSSITPRGTDLFRVLAANDNTQVSIQGTVYNLNSGKFLELPLEDPMFIEANEPILVAQYKKSAKSDNFPDNSSDPLMLIIPPVEQYISQYRVINAQGKSQSTQGNMIAAYDIQHITIIGDKLAVNNLLLDDTPVLPSVFQQVEQTGYFYANLKVTDGIHALESKGKFAAFVYGFGSANSYGYLGGMGLEILDLVPPRIYSSTNCFQVEGVVTDSTLSDSKIGSLTSKDLVNTTVNIPNFTPYLPVVPFTGELVNKFLDGEFKIVAKDSVGKESEDLIEVPGFTIGLEPNYNPDELAYRFEYPTDKESCFDVTLYNYGKNTTSVGYVKLKNNPDDYTSNTTGAFLLSPGESKTITFCTSSTENKEVRDTLIIGNACAERTVANLKFTFIRDDVPPRLVAETDSCNSYFTFKFVEDLALDIGVDSVRIISAKNCIVTSKKQNNTTIIVMVRVINSYEDAEFEVGVTDLMGTETLYSRNIPGFTLSMDYGYDKPIKFKDTQIGAVLCQPVELTNYGSFPISLDEIYLHFNTIFSVPPSQVPFEIAPGETRELEICFAPSSSKDSLIFDTLNIGMNCLINKYPMEGLPLPLIFGVDSKCDVALIFTTDSLRRSVSVTPNPIIQSGKIIIELPRETDVNVRLINTLGEVAAELFEAESIKGQLSINFDVTNISSGMYFIQVRFPDYVKSIPIMISR